MQRYFVPSTGWVDETHIQIVGDDLHHISRVMRMKSEDSIIACHPNGLTAECQITEITNDFVKGEVVKWIDEQKELPVHITIAQGLPKGDKLDLIVQKGTELGAYRFIPFQADRSIVKWDSKKASKKIDRYQKIAKEASEQSHRSKIPEVTELFSFQSLLKASNEYDIKLFAYEDEAKKKDFFSLRRLVKAMNKGQHVLAVIGPEGGFSEQEVQELKESGFHSVRLGPRILRTETAPFYLLASISYEFEELE